MPVLPEPSWAEPQPVGCEPSSILSSDVRPSIITGFLLRVLEMHFHNPDNIEDEVLKETLWYSDDKNSGQITSKILIKHASDYDPRDIGQRPACIVKHGPIEAKKISLRGKILTHLEENGNLKGESYLSLITGVHAIQVVAEGGMALDRLSEEVFFRMLSYVPCLIDELRVSDIYVAQMDAPVKVEGQVRTFVTTIQIPWTYVRHWILAPIAPILKKVNATYNTFDA